MQQCPLWCYISCLQACLFRASLCSLHFSGSLLWHHSCHSFWYFCLWVSPHPVIKRFLEATLCTPVIFFPSERLSLSTMSAKITRITIWCLQLLKKVKTIEDLGIPVLWFHYQIIDGSSMAQRTRAGQKGGTFTLQFWWHSEQLLNSLSSGFPSCHTKLMGCR